ALRRHCVRARREHLGDAGGAQPRFAAPDDGAQAGAAGADDDHVVDVILDRVGAAIEGRGRAACVGTVRGHGPTTNESFRMPKAEASATATAKNVLAMIRVSFADSSCT